MSANDEAGCCERNHAFVYHGREGEDVPRDVIHVRVHPSVKVIRAKAFASRIRLISVEFRDGLEVIEEEAFYVCSSLREILFPPSVRAIKANAFRGCEGLTTAILNDGLEEIGNCAFAQCALVRIVIPPAVRAIKDGAFFYCLGLTTVILNDGLEEIGTQAFAHSALVSIVIPPAVKEIDETAFGECSNLTSVQFCDEIEEFVSAESMRHWWNNGVHEKCLSTYCFFVRCNIPKRVGLVRSATLQTSIHGMLERIPYITRKRYNAHFDSIDSKLSAYEAKLSAYEGSTMLELAIWKSEIVEQTDGNINLLTPDMKIGCRIDSLSMVDIIVPNVLSFLHDDANEGDDDGDDNNNGGDDDGSDEDDEDDEYGDDDDNDDDSDEDDDDSDEDVGDGEDEY